MNKLIYVAFSVLLFYACRTENNTETSEQLDKIPAVIEDTVSKDIMDRGKWNMKIPLPPSPRYCVQLIKALSASDPTSFDSLLHPDFGCYVVESPGALPMITHLDNLESIKRLFSTSYMLEFRNKFMILNVEEDSLPEVDCDTIGFYSKSGCFMQDINVFGQEEIWNYCDLTPDEKSSIAELAKSIKKTVLHTAGFKAYFSFIDGKWYLTVLDIRIPCTA